MPHLTSCGPRVAPLVILVVCAPLLGWSAQQNAAVPPVLARMSGFQGRLEYAGHRSDVRNAPEVQGTAIFGPDRYSVDERAPNFSLHADDSGLVLRAGATTARTTDPLDADALINPWAIALAALARGGLLQRGALLWETPSGILMYLDRRGGAVSGIGLARDPRVSFTFADWSDVSGVLVPTRIVRLRNGSQDATFQIDRIAIVRDIATASDPRAVAIAQPSEQRPSSALVTTRANIVSGPDVTFPWRLVLTMFGMLALAVAIVAWFRRDAFTLHLCARAAHDPRGWRALASPAYVAPDGILLLEGNRYRVGPEFFARPVEVRFSALFLRVSAPGLSKAVVLPRRLPRFVAAHKPARRAATAGLTLIETLVSIAFFTVVIVGAVYPALTALARADYAAAQKRTALAAVANALTDEEMACAYGTTTPIGTATTTVNGMTVTVTVTNSTVAGARDIKVSAHDAAGRLLAQLATTVGPPVPPPGSSGP